MKYYVSSEHKEYEFDLVEYADSYRIRDKNQNEYEARIELIDENRFSLLLNNESFIVNASKKGDQYTSIIRGKQFDLTVDDEKSKAWKRLLEKSASSQKENQLKSPMPGLVVKILVRVGDSIKKGEPILILSAMKMENEVKASTDIQIKSILCSENQVVEKNEILIDFE